MSRADRAAERPVADFYDESVRESVRPPDPERGPLRPRAKRFGEGLLTGLALGSLLRRLF